MIKDFLKKYQDPKTGKYNKPGKDCLGYFNALYSSKQQSFHTLLYRCRITGTAVCFGASYYCYYNYKKMPVTKVLSFLEKKKHNSHFVGCGSSIRIRSRCSHGYAGSISWIAILIIFQTLLIVHLAHILFLLDCKFYLIACLFYQHNTILKTIFIIKNNQFLSLSHSQ